MDRDHPLDRRPVPYVVYGRIWPEDDLYAARRTQLDESRWRIDHETHGEGRRIGAHFEREPRLDRRRPALARALDQCRLDDAVLVVASLDKLAGNGPFMQQLVWSRVPVAFVDIGFPDLPTKSADRQTLGYLARFAEGRVLIVGDEEEPEAPEPEGEDRFAAARARYVKVARERRLEVAPTVLEVYYETGTFAGTARTLNGMGIETLSGGGRWHPGTVRTVIREASAQVTG